MHPELDLEQSCLHRVTDGNDNLAPLLLLPHLASSRSYLILFLTNIDGDLQIDTGLLESIVDLLRRVNYQTLGRKRVQGAPCYNIVLVPITICNRFPVPSVTCNELSLGMHSDFPLTTPSSHLG